MRRLSRTGLTIATGIFLVACQSADKAAESDTAAASPAAETALAAPASFAECAKADDDGHIAIADGLNAKVLQKGYGNVALLGDRVTVNAKLWVFDDAAEDGKGNFVWDSGSDGFTFDVGGPGFIEGWSPGVACMLVGEKRELVIASALAYGEDGRAPIPGNADIIYDLELLRVERAQE